MVALPSKRGEAGEAVPSATLASVTKRDMTAVDSYSNPLIPVLGMVTANVRESVGDPEELLIGVVDMEDCAVHDQATIQQLGFQPIVVGGVLRNVELAVFVIPGAEAAARTWKRKRSSARSRSSRHHPSATRHYPCSDGINLTGASSRNTA